MNESGLMFMLLARRVILIYPPESLWLIQETSNLFLPQSELVCFHVVWFVYKKITNKNQLWWFLRCKCLEKKKKYVWLLQLGSFSHWKCGCSFLRARRYSGHNCFSWACSWYQTANVWLDKGCMWWCVCVFVSTFPSASLSASCRVSCWLSCPPLTLSSDCFLSAVPDRK